MFLDNGLTELRMFFMTRSTTFVIRCAIWYYLCNLKNVKNTHGGVLILVKLQAQALLWWN